MGADAIVQALEQLEAGSAHETPQDESRVTYAARLERSDSPVDFTRPAHDLHNQIRGLHPWPLASARLDGRRVRLIASEVRESPAPLAEPGTVIAIEHDAIVTATGAGLLALRRVQLEGRPVVSARDFLNGHRVVPGDRFTTDRPGADG
jgi:methionyl-tRNA formyltransferase